LNTKLRCLLLDDELPGLTYLKMLCEQIDELEVVKAFNDPAVLLKEAAALDFDLCILDIEMPGMNGLDVAKALSGKAVIFTTAYKEYAADAYDLEAIDYIRKPIERTRLEKAIQKACDVLLSTPRRDGEEKSYAPFNTNKGKMLLFFRDVMLVTIAENDKRDKLVYLQSGEEIILKNTSFDQLLAVFPENDFCRVSKKDLVALKAVKFFVHNEITTQVLDRSGLNRKINLSEIYRKDFMSKL
jgi:DNA-binding LytR/AlgR family response regulator